MENNGGKSDVYQQIDECAKTMKSADIIRKLGKWVVLGTGAVVLASGVLINDKLEDLREEMIEDVASPELMKDFNQYLAERYSAEYKNVEKGFVTNTEYLDGLAKEDDYTTKFVGFCSQNEDRTIRDRVARYTEEKKDFEGASKAITDLSLGFASAGAVAYFGARRMKKNAGKELFDILCEDDNMGYDFR